MFQLHWQFLCKSSSSSFKLQREWAPFQQCSHLRGAVNAGFWSASTGGMDCWTQSLCGTQSLWTEAEHDSEYKHSQRNWVGGILLSGLAWVGSALSGQASSVATSWSCCSASNFLLPSNPISLVIFIFYLVFKCNTYCWSLTPEFLTLYELLPELRSGKSEISASPCVRGL